MLNDGSFRVMTVRATDMVAGIVEAQQASDETAGVFGELLCGSVLIRETMSPNNRVQVLLHGGDGAYLVADAWPEGNTRGLIQIPDGLEQFRLGAEPRLQVSRAMWSGEQQQGIVAFDPEAGVVGGMMRYFQESEQITTMVALGCVVRDGKVVTAGGLVVQLLPEVTQAPLAIMTARLEDFVKLGPLLEEHDADPQWLMDEVTYGFESTLLSESEIRFACPCSRERALAAVASLPTADLDEAIADQETLKTDCDYCRERYEITPADLAEIRSQQETD